MKVILFNDMSIVIAEISVSLHSGDNHIDIPTIGYIPNTLYIRTEYPYSIIHDTTVSITVDTDIPTYTFSYVYTTDAISGSVQYTDSSTIYTVDTDVDIDNIEFGIGTTLSYSEQDHHSDTLEYSLLGVPPYTTIPNIDIDTVYVIDGYSVHKVLSLNRSNEYGDRPIYPGILYYGDDIEVVVDRDTTMISIGEVYDIDIDIVDDVIVVDNNVDPYIDIVLTTHDGRIPSTVSILDDSNYEIDSTISVIRDEVQIRFSTTGIGSYTISMM